MGRGGGGGGAFATICCLCRNVHFPKSNFCTKLFLQVSEECVVQATHLHESVPVSEREEGMVLNKEQADAAIE